MSISQSILALVVCLVMHVGISPSAVAQTATRSSQLSQSSQHRQSSQPHRSAEVRYDGWSAVTPNTLTPNTVTPRSQAPDAATAEPSVRQVAYYQTQGSLSDLPVLPSGNPPNAGFAPSSLPQLPSFSNASTTGAGAMNANPNAGGMAEQSQVLPPPNVQPPLGGDRSDQFGAPGYGGPGTVPQVNGAPLANGLPYVTSAPRTGRYPTSPYMGPRHHLTNYQLRTVPAQTVSAQTGLSVPNAMTAAAQPPVLPQNRNVVGVYPTAYQQCAPGAAVNFPATGAVPGTSVPPTYPPNLTPGLYSPNNSGYSPLFSLGQEKYNVTLGRGLIGQPTVYVPGQPFRNFFRYISP